MKIPKIGFHFFFGRLEVYLALSIAVIAAILSRQMPLAILSNLDIEIGMHFHKYHLTINFVSVSDCLIVDGIFN